MGEGRSRRAVTVGALAALSGGAFPLSAAFAQPPAAPAKPEVLTSQTDAADRMTVMVRINGAGPFPFLVDTGAERSVVAADLAAELMLPPGGPLIVHGVAGAVTAPSALVGELAVGGRRLRALSLPVLLRTDIGAAGVLGIDALQGQRVELDFARREIRVQYASAARVASDEIVITAKSRFGQLVLIDSAYRGAPILVVVDTGAQTSIGNLALRRLIGADPVGQGTGRAEILSVTGQRAGGDWALVSNVKVGGFTVNRLPVVFADLHSFERWRLTDQPALLLGMDVLRQFEGVAVDFSRREVRFRGLMAAEDRGRTTLASLG